MGSVTIKPTEVEIEIKNISNAINTFSSAVDEIITEYNNLKTKTGADRIDTNLSYIETGSNDLIDEISEVHGYIKNAYNHLHDYDMWNMQDYHDSWFDMAYYQKWNGYKFLHPVTPVALVKPENIDGVSGADSPLSTLNEEETSNKSSSFDSIIWSGVREKIYSIIEEAKRVKERPISLGGGETPYGGDPSIPEYVSPYTQSIEESKDEEEIEIVDFNEEKNINTSNLNQEKATSLFSNIIPDSESLYTQSQKAIEEAKDNLKGLFDDERIPVINFDSIEPYDKQEDLTMQIIEPTIPNIIDIPDEAPVDNKKEVIGKTAGALAGALAIGATADGAYSYVKNKKRKEKSEDEDGYVYEYEENDEGFKNEEF